MELNLNYCGLSVKVKIESILWRMQGGMTRRKPDWIEGSGA